MAYDLATVKKIQDLRHPPVLRFFRWKRPTVSYGKHQNLADIQSQIPPGWEAVQRPTGGGLVFHGNDLCLSLCWRAGQPPLPKPLKEHYAWIHKTILDALPAHGARLANCRDCAMSPAPFSTRECFTEPVAFDVVLDRRKIVGGALCRTKDVFLYQGSVQSVPLTGLQERLQTAFHNAFQSGS